MIKNGNPEEMSDEELMKQEARLIKILENKIGYKKVDELHNLLEVSRELTLREGQ